MFHLVPLIYNSKYKGQHLREMSSSFFGSLSGSKRMVQSLPSHQRFGLFFPKSPTLYFFLVQVHLLHPAHSCRLLVVEVCWHFTTEECSGSCRPGREHCALTARGVVPTVQEPNRPQRSGYASASEEEDLPPGSEGCMMRVPRGW